MKYEQVWIGKEQVSLPDTQLFILDKGDKLIPMNGFGYVCAVRGPNGEYKGWANCATFGYQSAKDLLKKD